jgi:hypothetical protein
MFHTWQAQVVLVVVRRIGVPLAPQLRVKVMLVEALQQPQVMALAEAVAQEPQVRLEQPVFVAMEALV